MPIHVCHGISTCWNTACTEKEESVQSIYKHITKAKTNSYICLLFSHQLTGTNGSYCLGVPLSVPNAWYRKLIIVPIYT